MKVYLISAVSVMFLSVIVSLIMPEGKLNKSVTFVMRLICIAVLIRPVTGIFKINDSAETGNYFDYEYIESVYSKHQGAQLEELIYKEFGFNAECDVEIDYVDGYFKPLNVQVGINEENAEEIDRIYEYLDDLGYINITVYAKST